MYKDNQLSNEIDAVITWVDGTDPVHASKRAKALNQPTEETSTRLPTGHHKTRFLDNGELYYCVASLRKYAPWIRTIFIITDNQVPDFLTQEVMDDQNIKIVDHTEIFKSYEWALPTFNSMSIETACWRIPGLSDRFLYLNDDFILNVPVREEDFFVDGNVILRGEWKKITNYTPFRIKLNHYFSRFVKKYLGITRSLNFLTQIRSARLAGFKSEYFCTPHVPHPIRKHTVEEFYQNNPAVFEENIKHPFRDTDQHTIQYLAYHLELKKGQGITKNADDLIMINGETDFRFMLKNKLQKINHDKGKFICIQGFEALPEQIQDQLTEILNTKFSTEMELLTPVLADG